MLKIYQMDTPALLLLQRYYAARTTERYATSQRNPVGSAAHTRAENDISAYRAEIRRVDEEIKRRGRC